MVADAANDVCVSTHSALGLVRTAAASSRVPRLCVRARTTIPNCPPAWRKMHARGQLLMLVHAGDAPPSPPPLGLCGRSPPSPTGEEVCTWGLSETQYYNMHLRLYKALIDPFDPVDARKSARDDWKHDCKGSREAGGAPTMGRIDVYDAIFEITDLCAARALYQCTHGLVRPCGLPSRLWFMLDLACALSMNHPCHCH